MKSRALRREPPADIAASRARIGLLLIFLLGAALRLIVTLGTPMGLNGFSDDNAYISGAAVFAKTGYVTYGLPDTRSGVVGAGMPLLLGLLFTVFGYQPTGLTLSHIAFSMIGLCTAYGGYQLGALLHSRRAGVLAAAVLALEPGLIAANCLFYTETPYMCLNLFGLLLLVRCARKWRLPLFLAGVLCVCGAAAFKGLALLAPLCVLPLAFRRGAKLKSVLGLSALGVLIFGLVFLPWCVRNKQVVGDFVPFPTSQGDQKLLGSYVGVGYPPGTYAQGIAELDTDAWVNGYQADTYRRIASRGAYAQERLNQWLRTNPLEFAYTHLIYKPLTLLSMRDYPAKVFALPKRAVQYAWVGVLALGLWGLTFGAPKRIARQAGFFTPALYLALAALATAMYVPLERYNTPHTPFIALYAAVGLCDLWGRVRRAGPATKDVAAVPPDVRDA